MKDEFEIAQTLPLSGALPLTLDEEVCDTMPPVGAVHEREMERLSPQAEDWMLGLPVDLRPSCTAAWYPHVVNRLCELWPDAAARSGYLGDLLFTRREGRRGFETLVMEELFDLQRFGMEVLLR